MEAKETVLAVEGMTCGACVRHVRQALGGLQGVAEVDVSLKDGKVLVRHDATTAPIDELVGALGRAGYEARTAA